MVSGKTTHDDKTRRTAGGRRCGVAWLALALIGSAAITAHAGQARIEERLPGSKRAQLEQSASGGTVERTTPPTGNVNQVMRGILFPNANVIFNVQLEDPTVKQTTARGDAAGKGFSIAAWGDTLYERWDVVSYAAVALEESAALLARSDRLCQNGKPAPVAQADWIRFTVELSDTAKAIYVASQAKNRAAVIELTDRLNNSCNSCHGVYRRGADVNRCVPRP